jgi:hypothetical protein
LRGLNLENQLRKNKAFSLSRTDVKTVLQDRLIQLLTQLGVSSYTITPPAQGAGSHGRRMGDVAGYNTNIEAKTIVTSKIFDQLLEDLKPFQATYALIAFQQTVEGLFD